MTAVTLARAVTASTQSHDTEVTQTTSGKKLIRADGSRGWYLHLTGMTEAFTPAGGGGFVGLTYAFPALTVAA